MSIAKSLIAAGLFVTTTAGAAYAQAPEVIPYDGPPLPKPEAPLLTPGVIYADAAPIVKVLMTLSLLAIPAALVLLVIALAKPGSAARLSGLLRTLAGAAATSGGLGAAYGIANSFIGVAATNTTSIAVIAPGIAEAMFCLTLGLLAALIACLSAGAIGLRGAPKPA